MIFLSVRRRQNLIDNVFICVNFIKKDFGGVLLTGYIDNDVVCAMGVARIFQRGGHTVSNRGYSRFCNLIIVGCLHKKRLTKGGGGHGHPRTPLATPLVCA